MPEKRAVRALFFCGEVEIEKTGFYAVVVTVSQKEFYAVYLYKLFASTAPEIAVAVNVMQFRAVRARQEIDISAAVAEKEYIISLVEYR